jgi:hypothetical protein
MSAQFIQGAGDGLLGLAWGSINTVQPTPVQTPVENMITEQDIPQSAELFTANLGSWRDANDPDKGVSFYTFGYIDQDVVKASGQEIAYTPVDNSQGFWMFDSASATVNGTTTPRQETLLLLTLEPPLLWSPMLLAKPSTRQFQVPLTIRPSKVGFSHLTLPPISSLLSPLLLVTLNSLSKKRIWDSLMLVMAWFMVVSSREVQ